MMTTVARSIGAGFLSCAPLTAIAVLATLPPNPVTAGPALLLLMPVLALASAAYFFCQYLIYARIKAPPSSASPRLMAPFRWEWASFGSLTF
jgi:ABC-type uncharacterized transport system permease subunit